MVGFIDFQYNSKVADTVLAIGKEGMYNIMSILNVNKLNNSDFIISYTMLLVTYIINQLGMLSMSYIHQHTVTLGCPVLGLLYSILTIMHFIITNCH